MDSADSAPGSADVRALAFPLRLAYMPRHSTGGFYAAPDSRFRSGGEARFASHDPPRLNRTRISSHGFARFHHAPAARGGRAFRPPVAPLEPEDGALHLRLAQLDPHHRPRPDGAAAASGAEDGPRHRRQGRPGAVRRHQAPGVGRDRDRRQALGAIFRQRALARRHADQLEDDFGVDLAAAQARRAPGRGREGPDQEGAPHAVARARQARDRARRHQGHGRRSRSGVRHRHQQGSAGDQGGQPPQDSGDRDPRHQQRSGRHHLSGPGQRRRRPRHPALLRSHRSRGDRRHLAQPGRAGRRSGRSRGAGRRSAAGDGRARGLAPSRKPRPTVSSSWPRRAARRTIWPSSPASARRSSRSSTNMACSIIGSSPR